MSKSKNIEVGKNVKSPKLKFFYDDEILVNVWIVVNMNDYCESFTSCI